MVKPKPNFADDRTTTAFFAELKESAEAGAMTSRAQKRDQKYDDLLQDAKYLLQMKEKHAVHH